MRWTERGGAPHVNSIKIREPLSKYRPPMETTSLLDRQAVEKRTSFSSVQAIFEALALAIARYWSWGSDSNGAKSHVKGRSWDRLASQDLSPSVSQGTIWRYVAVDRRLGYA